MAGKHLKSNIWEKTQNLSEMRDSDSPQTLSCYAHIYGFKHVLDQ